MVERYYKVRKAAAKLTHINGCKPTVDEVAFELCWKDEKVWEIVINMRQPISFSTPVGDDDDSIFSDFIPDDTSPSVEKIAEKTVLSEAVEEALSVLPPREEAILRLRFGFGCTPHTLEEVGEKFNVTRERARQLEAKALRILRRPTVAKRIRDFAS